MPGLIYPSSASSGGTIAAMKLPHDGERLSRQSVPSKKRKVLHHLHHTQPVQHIVDPISAEFGFGDSKDFYDQQLRRAIAIQCKALGFESARADALEEFRGLVDSCTTLMHVGRVWLIQRRHDKVSGKCAKVDGQRATNRNCSSRLDICARKCWPSRLSGLGPAFRYGRDTTINVTTAIRTLCPS